MLKKAKLILFDGMDKSGKTTTIKGLKSNLENKGYKVKMLSDPSHELMDYRNLVLNVEKKNKFTDFFLFQAARLELVMLIQEAKDSGMYDFILLDRFDLSTIAHQTMDMSEEDSTKVFNVLNEVTKLYEVTFDKVFIFCPTQETVMTRLNCASDDLINNYDSCILGHYTHISDSYKNMEFDEDLHKRYGCTFDMVYIDQSSTILEVLNEVIEKVNPLLD